MSGSLWPALSALRARSELVDLTHAFHPGIPHTPAFVDSSADIVCDLDTDGFRTHLYGHVGQWGTHADPPSHFVEGGRTLDQIGVDEMVLPLVVLDVSPRVATDEDYAVRLEDVHAWEASHGRMPHGAFVALRTGWARRWPDQAAMRNTDAQGRCRTPGWSLEVLTFLCQQRGIAACGHETLDTDAGLAGARDGYPCERYVLERDRYQIELLANLHRTPEAGAIVVATFPKPLGGSGFPARVFAMVPRG